MITKTITVEIPAGLEVRPVAVLVQVANQLVQVNRTLLGQDSPLLLR